MPIECSQLQDKPQPLSQCPACGAEPFQAFLRGMVQRTRWRKYILFGPWRDYCTVICSECKEIVGYESPEVGQEMVDGRDEES